MPFYEFKCTNGACGEYVVERLDWKDLAGRKRRPPKCPKCGGFTEFVFPAPKGRVK